MLVGSTESQLMLDSHSKLLFFMNNLKIKKGYTGLFLILNCKLNVGMKSGWKVLEYFQLFLEVNKTMELWYEQEQHVRKFLYKSLWKSAWLWSRVRVAINKKQIFLITRPPTCWKPGTCFWFVWKDKRRITANLQLNL